MRNPDPVLWLVFCVLVSLITGALACKVIHESGHALTAWALGGEIQSVRIGFPRKLGFYHVGYTPPSKDWQKGLTALMGTGATTIVAYALALVVLNSHPSLWLRLSGLAIAWVCAWDMFLYATLPLLGLRRGLVAGGRHAEPVDGAQLMGVPAWLFLIGLTVSFVAFHALVYRALRGHG
jgi:hypothetical protein